MRVRLHREGTNILIITMAILLAINVPLWIFCHNLPGLWIPVTVISLVLYLLIVNFFRSPRREFPGDPTNAVVSAADGTVGNLWEDPFHGYCMSVVHSGGATSIYRNLAEEPSASVAVGAHVVAGQILGYIGESSLVECAEEPHLHYELEINGTVVDPLDYLPEVRATAADGDTD